MLKVKIIIDVNSKLNTNCKYMAKDKVCLIINPISGTESKKYIPEEVAAAIDQKKYDLFIRVTGHPNHASEIARDAVKNNYKFVITAGGDGTVNEVARELINCDTVLGILPYGSGNGLARELGIPLDSEKAIEIILSAHTRTIDYGVANDHIFFCTCGLGSMHLLVTDLLMRKRGPLGYVRNVLESGRL